jgi:hypothetical protein
MNILQQIEQQFDFKYPTLYHKLFADGMLETGSGQEWYDSHKDNPLLLFNAYDFELRSFENIIAEIEEIRDPENWRGFDPQYKFVPFAMTYGGCNYAFQFDRQNGDDVPVTLVPHDMDEATVLAKNLQDFIFRMLLEGGYCLEEGYGFWLKGRDFKTNLFNHLRTHKPYLTPNMVVILEEVYSREVKNHPNSEPGLISKSELEEIIQREIGFDGLDEEFTFCE